MVKKDKNTVSVKQIRSLIGSTKKQIASIKGLGLRSFGHWLRKTREIR